MYILDTIKKEIVGAISQTLGNKLIRVSDLVYPPNPEMGDLSLPCFNIAKAKGVNPGEMARDLVGKIKSDGVIVSVSAQGPYVNFILDSSSVAKALAKEIKKLKVDYGTNKSGKGKRVMLEYSNANTHKEYHVGHLRNICYGGAVNSIMAANGYKNIPVSYINDFGIHVAKTLWAYLAFYNEAELPKNKGKFLGEVYVRSTREAKKSKTAKGLIETMMKKIESRQGKEYELWQKTREWSIEQFTEIYNELGVKFKHIFYESEYIQEGHKLVKKLKAKGILKDSQGAVIADLEKYGLGVLVVLRSDGTATYPVADIPLAMAKIKKYKPDISVYVVDGRQSLYFKQLFKILELIGLKQELLHLGYDVVKLPSGMMSSRSGNVITYEDLRDEITKRAVTETKKRHPDWDKTRINNIVLALTKGTIKFEMLKVNANQSIVFDINKALSFNGFTAAYLLYAYARIKSVFKKFGDDLPAVVDFSLLKEEKEHKLLIKLIKYPEIVLGAGIKYDPSRLAKYLFELASLFNDYYHEVPVLKAEEKTRDVRLVLLNAVSQVLNSGLELLGINTINEM